LPTNTNFYMYFYFKLKQLSKGSSRDPKNFQQSSHDEQSTATALLESGLFSCFLSLSVKLSINFPIELRRVQLLVGDMQKQRQELSQAVRELTDNSNAIYQEMNRNLSGIKKRTLSASWTETDLDLMEMNRMNLNDSVTPLFIETCSNTSNSMTSCAPSTKTDSYDINKLMMNERLLRGLSDEVIDSIALDNDELLEDSAFSNLSQQEKQEIKTVRIVKRENQQRQRDRERTGYLSQNLDQVLEEEAQIFNNTVNSDSYNAYQRSKSALRPYSHMQTHEIYDQSPVTHMQTKLTNDFYHAINMQPNNYPVSMIDRSAEISHMYSDKQVSHQIHQMERNYSKINPVVENVGNKTEAIQSFTKLVGEISPVFQSEAARQIMIEMSGNSGDDDAKVPDANKQRRAIPKEKRRHFTAPHHVNAKMVETIQTENDINVCLIDFLYFMPNSFLLDLSFDL
jgi:uncharacterized protein YoxC